MSDRYARQSILPEVGAAGQARLGAAGVGRLMIGDHDRVEKSNLPPQPLYRMTDLGRPKVHAARVALLQANPEVSIDTLEERHTAANAAPLVGMADAVIDAADSFAVTYVLSDGCQRANTPLVSASVLGLSGYVGAFCGGAPSYRAVFPEMPGAAGSCAEAGVLGTAVGVMGTLQAHLALAVLLKWQPAALGRLISVDFRTLHVGGFSFAGAREPAGTTMAFIAPAEVSVADIVIDLRSLTEVPVSPFPSAVRIGVEALEKAEISFPAEPRIVLCCRTGVRAWRAARALQSQGHANVALIAMGE